jgi:pimeloyl-ACP methyl ester carboxylesterase
MLGVEVEGRRVAYRRTGTGPPTIVLIGAAGSCERSYAAVLDPLAELGTVVAYERVGYGDSDPLEQPGTDGLRWRTRELAGLLEAIDAPTPVVVVGHSFGALLAQLFALDHPHLVAGVVSVDGDDGIPTDLPPWPEFPPDVEMEAFRRLTVNLPDGLVPPPPSDQQTAAAERNDRQAGFDRLAAARDDGAPPDVPFVHLGATGHWFGPPELLPVSGEHVIEKLREKHQRTASAHPRGRFVEAARSGHFVQFDEPDLVVEAVRSIVSDRDRRAAEGRPAAR